MISYFIFVNTESISTSDSQTTDVKEKEAALKISFVTVYNQGSFACIGYIYSVDPQRVFAHRSCITPFEFSSDEKNDREKIRVKSMSGESKVKDVLGTLHFIAIIVSIYTYNFRI